MRSRPLTWLLLSVLCFAAAFYFWRLGDQWVARRSGLPSTQSSKLKAQSLKLTPSALTQAGALNSPSASGSLTNHPSRNTNLFALRLSNTTAPIGQLLRNDRAILLENALLDTARPGPSIPDHLRAQGDPGSYLVQARGPIDNAFRSLLQTAGAAIVSYIPNNAYLVRASAAVAQQLQAAPQTQAVLPYEPYYKLKPSLLKLAVAQQPLPDNSVLNVLLFADARAATLAALNDLGVQVLGEDTSPFGPVVQALPPAESLPFVAGLPGVQEVELAVARAPANDLSRVRVGVSINTLVATNYLGLTGTNILVNVNDSGVDATHPDLTPRVFGNSTNALLDPNGHGTHVAGIIASSGVNSIKPPGPVSVGAFASGSISNASFRGKAPGASLFVQPVGLYTGPFNVGSAPSWPSDSALQEGAAQTNALISNNSWNYVGGDSQSYDLHAASYDAAVRDALPNVSGAQPLLIVFSAGDSGGGNDDGTGGNPDSMQSPATAKNVITVGAIEQFRNITNNVWVCSDPNTCTTNQPWLGMTSSSNDVAAFSSRGNVGIGTEGTYGRFKPDVVAPGTFVVSTRSGQWDTNAYYNPTSHIYYTYQNLLVGSNALWANAIFVPDNAVQMNLYVVPNTNSPVPFPNMLLYVNQASPPTNAASATTVGTNQVSLPPDAPLNPVNAVWYYAVANQTTQDVHFDLVTDLVVTNDLGNYLQVLAGLNNSLGPYYRYESGTSMAAADVSGVLALMQEFFQQRLGLTNSPALMKALLINGARSVSAQYDFNAQPTANSQGWGLINLPTTVQGGLTNLGATTNSMVMFDQTLTNALATGQSQTRYVSLTSLAQSQPLRVTLVWTDPPGNPVASVKLVNNLDLIVTNLATGDVFFGNDFIAGIDYNLPWATNTVPNIDVVNNVQNVFLSPTLGSNYSVTVVGSRVNVNAVYGQSNNVCQDYALVISSGDGLITNALAVSSSPLVYLTQPLVTVVTNMFTASTTVSGGFLFNQRAGANAPLLGTNTITITNDADAVLTIGMTNQWHFYAMTNNTSFTNAAFLTFLPLNLAVPRMGVFSTSAAQATRPEADIDLFVAPPSVPNNFALTNLDPVVVAAADKSVGRGGTEIIIYSNATPGVYYIGVQSEDQQAAEYAFFGVFSELPFSQSNSNGDLSLLGIPAPQPIPDAYVDAAGITISGSANIVCLAPEKITLHRVIVTNNITHQLMGDMLGTLTLNGGNPVVLNNHSPDSAVFNQTYIYDDSQELNVGGAQHTDGPGSLMNYAGQQGSGLWMLTEVDSAPSHVGTNNFLYLFLQHQPLLTSPFGITVTIQPGACREDFVYVPADATSLTVTVAVVTSPGPIDFTLSVCPTNGGPCKSLTVTNALGGFVTISQTDVPPLQSGSTYFVRTCNLGSSAITLNLRATFGFSQNTILPVITDETTNPVPILPDAVTDIYLTNNFHGLISSLDVGLLVQDPRVSDLAITLISPDGTRVLLFENRGAGSTNGLGTFNLSTNYLMVPFYTNNFDLAPVGLYAPGAAFQGWNVVSNYVDVMDDYTCLCLSNHILALFDGSVTNILPTTNSLPTNSIPYTLSFKVNHLPWLEGMVTWWPLDVDGSDIFGGYNGLLLGDVAFSTGQTNAFFENFTNASAGLSPMWQASLPNAGTGSNALPVETYAGPPTYTFGTVNGTNAVLLLNNPTLAPLTRVGWSSATVFNGQNFCYTVRFNTLNQGAGHSIDGFIEIWILDAANSNRFDVISPFTGSNGTNLLLVGNSIDPSYNTLPFNFQTNTWYRLVLSAAPYQGVRAQVLSDSGTELAGVSFIHSTAAFPSGYKIGLSQFMGELGTNTASAPVDVAINYIQLTSGLAGEVNQAFYGDGVATRMVVPGCPQLDLGLGRGFSIEGWINPFNVTNPAPLVEWYDDASPTNLPPLGVEFWLALTNGPGSLGAVIWDTNLQPHIITTFTNALTNAGWQHVALTYDTNSGWASLYVNGITTNLQPLVSTNLGRFVPHTSGDIYLGYDPTIITTPISYLNFSSIAGLNLTGPAAQVGNVLQLTPSAPQQWGANAWVARKQPCAAGFSTTYQCRWTNLGSTIGGDGGDEIWFTVQNDSPTSGASYGSYCNGTNFVSVFLNARGAPAAGDISGNSIALVTNNAYFAQRDLTPLGIQLKNGAVHTVQATFNGTAINVWLDGIQVLATNVPASFLKIGTDSQGYGWVGLGAACGANYADQDILSWTFGGPTPGTAFAGGLDEFSIYDRALSPCEVNAIFHAGSRGKYGTNVLVCPVNTEVTLFTTNGPQIYTFTNGLAWTNNGPYWETNTILFSTYTNPTPIVVCGLNPYNPADSNAPNNLNIVVDDFVLSELVPQTVDGPLYFTDNTNLATLPIKFAPTPFAPSNFPPVLIFSNTFVNAAAGVYLPGATILGGTNSPALGLRNWTATNGPVTVVSNAFLDVATTNWLAMATGAVQCLLPTSPGLRYQLTCNLRGPCAVGWWNGSVDPLSGRALDLISGNNGAFFYDATNTAPAYVGDINQVFVGTAGFYFNGQIEPPPPLDPDIWPEDIDDPSSQIELGDPPQLQFTNAFTLEGWFKPILNTNYTECGTELLFFRGYPEPLDCRGLGDPYWLALEPTTNLTTYDIRFHIADAHTGTLGADVFTTNAPILIGGGSNDGWWHIAAVFDKPFTNITVPTTGTNFVTITTNAMRLYLNGTCVVTNYTTLSPYQTLDPALNPGADIGERCRFDWTEPFRGFMDEVTAYARALTDPEIAAIAAATTAGKADPSQPPAQSLAELSVSVDGTQLGVVYGDNSQWSTYTTTFTALDTNALITLQSLLPGTLVDGITLSQVASDLYYLPEVPLSDIYGEDGFGVWTLEIVDDGADLGAPTNSAQLIEWQLNLGLAPSNPPPVITLSHGILYTNSLPPNGIQYFIVPVPQWAKLATNILYFADQVQTANPLPVTVLFNQTNFPTLTNFPLIGPLVSAGVTTLSTNSTPPLTNGQPYYLAVTNPNPFGVTFAYGVWFDITTLSNCQMLASNVVGVAGIPRYFQFDVPTNGTLAPQSVSFCLSGAACSLKVVLSEHLPLPDLNHYDYTSQQPCTNDQIVMLVTNSTPFPIETNRWYVGVFNNGPTNTPFLTNITYSVEACSTPLYPTIILLTNGIPFVVSATNSPFAAPPGPPQQLFFDLIVTNFTDGILFELYDLSGDADLVLQQDGPPTMPPYFDISSFPGGAPQQIVLRTSGLPATSQVADLRGQWFLGVYNNEQVNVAYTIRAVLQPSANGLLVSDQPYSRAFGLILTQSGAANGWLLSWHSVIGERYIVQYTPSISAPVTWTNLASIIATTPLTTYQAQSASTTGFFRVVQVSSFLPALAIQLVSGNQVSVSWSTAYPGYTLQSRPALSGAWTNDALASPAKVLTLDNQFIVSEPIGASPKFYRLIK